MALPELHCPETGHAEIDQQHWGLQKRLTELVDAVNSSKVEAVRARMDAAIEEVVTHFAFEEQLMQESAFPNFARHKAAHDTFVADTQRFAKELAAKGITPNFRRWAVGRLLEWFRFHVVANDVELGRYLMRRR